MERWERLQRLNVAKGYQARDLAGVAELADDVFHVPRTVVTSWNARRHKISFPMPVIALRSGPVFSISEYVVAWNDWQPKRGNKSGSLDDQTYYRLNRWYEQIRQSEHGI